MSIAGSQAVSTGQPLGISPDPRAGRVPMTMHNYGQTLLWTLIAVGVCGVGYLLEKYVVIPLMGLDYTKLSLYRMFKNPAELPMRLFGLPHFIVGLSFMLSSKRMRGAKSWAQFVGLLAIGTGFCWLFWEYGWMLPDDKKDATGAERAAAMKVNPLAILIFYFYFLIHGFRDEAFFYKAYGDMPKDAGPTHDRIMAVLQLLMLGLLISLALPAYILYGEYRPEFKHPALEAIFPADWHYALRFGATFGPMLLITCIALWRISKEFPDRLRGLWRMHYPILTVFSVAMVIILVALLVGPFTFNLVVLMHFVGWYLFGRYSMRSRPPATPPKSTWSWIRTTQAGFTTYHLGLLGLVVVLVAVSVYGFGKSGTLWEVVGTNSFYYWTIMHVTLSFFPRK